jgi:hypothetical protein
LILHNYISYCIVSKFRQNLSDCNLKNDLKHHIYMKQLCDTEEKLKENNVSGFLNNFHFRLQFFRITSKFCYVSSQPVFDIFVFYPHDFTINLLFWFSSFSSTSIFNYEKIAKSIEIRVKKEVYQEQEKDRKRIEDGICYLL